MTTPKRTFNVALVLVALVIGGEAHATAFIGGVISTTFAEGLGSCNKSKLIPLDTRQDTFSLSLAATCTTSAASGDLRGDAATGSVGMRLSTSNLALAAAEVSFIDSWVLTVAPGTPSGTYTLPFSFTVEGTVSPGSIGRLNRFVDYVLSARNVYSGLPSGSFAVNGSVTSVGAFSQTFSGTVDFQYTTVGRPLPLTAEISLILFAPQIEKGTLDFFNTASASIDLPEGWSAATSSGLPLVFAPVPEPISSTMMLLGLGCMYAGNARRRSRQMKPC